jgi:hypothetical protein
LNVAKQSLSDKIKGDLEAIIAVYEKALVGLRALREMAPNPIAQAGTDAIIAREQANCDKFKTLLSELAETISPADVPKIVATLDEIGTAIAEERAAREKGHA